ncbi:peptide MFS transporter [Tenacibaculum soleae]|uniref:MFS transporter n=1 Tax=Tenacibaculum soleae TaxID=447689 RepID=A0A1B9Y0D3_9FLAO|nr:peptide MFS transporter [Tenacibaculum soleae]MDO6745130.1 peptide MFS transporter [Tenacibaculum soleae]MDO6813645.1 peptide MFS transporter [Tenacibaculum soleae]OCK43161.1 MFS transporter [Tenacibaculum soleae]
MDTVKQEEFLGHPKGLYVLFFVEMWERFSYYGMRAILTLYLAAPILLGDPQSGFGWTNAETISFYGTYTMLVYLTSIPGGWIADKFIGQKKAVMLGGLLLCIGHGILAVDAQWAFFTGLLFIVIGVGFLKPNISTMVGGLYPKGDDRRDKGFYVFYIGINLGAFFGALAVGIVAAEYGWHYGFGLAGIGMALGQIVYMFGLKYLEGVGEFLGKKDSPDKELMKKPLTKVEKDRMLVMFLSFLIIIVFWGAFEQAGGLMSLYTEQKTDRLISFLDYQYEVPAAVFQSVNAFFIIVLGTLVGGFWHKWGRKGKESSSLFKMAIGVIIMAFGFFFMSKASTEVVMNGDNVVEKSAMTWLVLAYLFHTIGELCASPVALSFITKLAPVKYASFMMGAYFAATGLGNKVAGLVGEMSEGAGEFQVFTGIAVFCTLFGILILLILKPLKRLTHGAEDIEVTSKEETEGFELADNN